MRPWMLPAAVAALAVAGCSGQESTAPTSSSSSPTYQQQKTAALSKAEPAVRTFADVTARVPAPVSLKGTPAERYVSKDYATKYTEGMAGLTASGLTVKGSTTVARITGEDWDPAAKTATFGLCTRTSTRVYDKAGKDVTTTPDGKPAPAGARPMFAYVHLREATEGWVITAVEWQKEPKC